MGQCRLRSFAIAIWKASWTVSHCKYNSIVFWCFKLFNSFYHQYNFLCTCFPHLDNFILVVYIAPTNSCGCPTDGCTKRTEVTLHLNENLHISGKKTRPYWYQTHNFYMTDHVNVVVPVNVDVHAHHHDYDITPHRYWLYVTSILTSAVHCSIMQDFFFQRLGQSWGLKEDYGPPSNDVHKSRCFLYMKN